MEEAVTISPFRIENYNEAVSVWEKCEGIGLSSADSRENIQKYLERNPGMSFTAIRNGKIIGTVLCGHDGRRGFIHHLAVLPEFRKQGIGKALADHCRASLKKENIDKCHIFIFRKNRSGIRFWEKMMWLFRNDIAVMSINI